MNLIAAAVGIASLAGNGIAVLVWLGNRRAKKRANILLRQLAVLPDAVVGSRAEYYANVAGGMKEIRQTAAMQGWKSSQLKMFDEVIRVLTEK